MKKKPKIEIAKKPNRQGPHPLDEYEKYRQGTTMFGHPSEGKRK